MKHQLNFAMIVGVLLAAMVSASAATQAPKVMKGKQIIVAKKPLMKKSTHIGAKPLKRKAFTKRKAMKPTHIATTKEVTKAKD